MLRRIMQPSRRAEPKVRRPSCKYFDSSAAQPSSCERLKSLRRFKKALYTFLAVPLEIRGGSAKKGQGNIQRRTGKKPGVARGVRSRSIGLSSQVDPGNLLMLLPGAIGYRAIWDMTLHP